MKARPTLVGEVVGLVSMVDPDLFKRECQRLWRESVKAVGGVDPTVISDAVARVVLDPFASIHDLPGRYTDEVRVTPLSMPPRRQSK